MQPQSLPPDAQMMQFVTGFWSFHILVATAKLAIPDRLDDGPRTSPDLASELGARPDYLHRLLRAATSLGVFSEDGEGRFANTPLSNVLRSKHRPSLRHVFMDVANDWSVEGWKTLTDSVLTGRTAFDRVYGMSMWDYFASHPEPANLFNQAMSDLSVGEGSAVATAYDFSALGSLCDVAGGHGLLLASILEANPRLRGTLFDRPHVVADARRGALSVYADRCEIVSGDMFESVPSGFDAYIMKFIIHDWNDEKSQHILTNCRAGIPDHGRLLVIDQVVPQSNEPSPSKLMDISMMLFIDGIERTEEQFRNLFASSGWQLTHIIPTQSRLCIIEGEPA